MCAGTKEITLVTRLNDGELHENLLSTKLYSGLRTLTSTMVRNTCQRHLLMDLNFKNSYLPIRLTSVKLTSVRLTSVNSYTRLRF